jgi:CTP:molybdopterin cytidylyltransferase MocA
MGARPLLEAHKELVRTVEVGHDGIHLDVDTWEDYLILKKWRRDRAACEGLRD